jgi:L-lactate dehydrogenase complex protein LldG
VVLRAALGVAENGACWIEGASMPFHALVVIPQHLVVVVDAAALVPDLHAAYARLELAKRPRWGLFLAGPSKTADIEQALVIGAHGARSSTTLLVSPG